MKGTQIFLDYMDGQEAAALVVDGRLEDLIVDSEAFAPGPIFRAKVDRPAKGQGGVVVSFPEGRGFLRQIKGVSVGQNMLVQVTGYADEGKAIPLTTKLLFKSRYVIITPDAPGLNLSRRIRDEKLRDALLEYIHNGLAPLTYGIILRSSCAAADFEDVLEDAKTMLSVVKAVLEDDTAESCQLLSADSPHHMAWREWTTEAIVEQEAGCFYSGGVLDHIEALNSPKVCTHAGSYFIEQTRALCAIDVNTGVDGSLASGLKANIAMARDLPRQLRLRGIGGQVVIDPAPMPKKDRKLLDNVLKAAFRQDDVQTHILGWTALGLIELQRARTRPPLPLANKTLSHMHRQEA